MPRLTPVEARAILEATGAGAQDFHALRSDVVERLIAAADARGYRKPKNANGSRARSFHAYLARTAARAVEYDVQTFTGGRYGWETVCTEDNILEARQRLREYRANMPGYSHRIRRVTS